MTWHDEQIHVSLERAGERLDRFLSACDWAPSRSQLKAAIARGEITVNGERVKAGYALRGGDRVEIALRPVPGPDLIPEAIPLTVLFEDEHLLILDKASGMVVHPGPGHPTGTLVHALLAHCGAGLQGVGDELRPGLVHRLDRETSGVMVVAKTGETHASLGALFAAHDLSREYLALCFAPGLDEVGSFDTLHGRHPRDRKRFTTRLSRGRRAVTRFRVVERFVDGAALLRCRLETGRTHQVRVHLSEHGAPILGDRSYGGRRAGRCRLIQRPALHAVRLAFRHPVDGRDMDFEQPPPADFGAALEALRSGRGWA